MDTLVALGATAAFGYSTFALFAMTSAQVRGDTGAVMDNLHEFYFESAAMILTLITVGKLLEARSKGKTTDALKGLMRLAPKTATVVRDGVETVVPIEEVRKGDRFVVRPGEHIPVDGVVLEGTGAVNESALTGESIPVDKAAGDPVSAATLNQSGFLTCQATRVGEDTTLSQIIQMVSDAAGHQGAHRQGGRQGLRGVRAHRHRSGGCDHPGLAAAGAERRLRPGPGHLRPGHQLSLRPGLATPVAIMVGNGVGAKNGILFKTAVSLEAAGQVEIVALDKTGTITAGEPKVTDLLPASGVTGEELLRLACTLERNSEHPLVPGHSPAGPGAECAARRDHRLPGPGPATV